MLGHGTADPSMQLFAVLAQFAHLTQYRDAPRCRRIRKQHEHRLHRTWIRVVAIVNDQRTAQARSLATAARGPQDPNRIDQVRTVNTKYGGRRQRRRQIHGVMASDQTALKPNTLVTPLAPQNEPHTLGPQCFNAGRLEVGPSASAESHYGTIMHISKRPHALVIGVQDGRAVRRKRLDQFSFRQCNLIRRRKILNVRLTHVRHDPDCWRRDLGQPRNLTAMVHAHLEHTGFGGVIGAQQRQRQAKIVVQVPLRFRHAKAPSE